MLSTPGFTKAVSRAVEKGLETKGRFDKNIDAVLGLLNLPTRSDLTRIMNKLEVIQGSLTNLSLRIDRLLAREAGHPPKRHPKAPPSSEDTA